MNLRKIIKEEMDDMWQNMFNDEPNIWLSYQMVAFDEVPTKEDVVKIIKDAFKTGYIKKDSIDSWEKEGLEEEASSIASIAEMGESPYLRIDLNDGWLYFSTHYQDMIDYYPNINPIKYSEAKNYLIRESDDPLKWIKDINTISVGTVFRPIYEKRPEQAFYYVIESIDEDTVTYRFPTTPNGEYNHYRTSRGTMDTQKLMDDIREGKLSIINNITESEDDDWVWTQEEYFVDPKNLKLGDRIRVHNLGDEPPFLNWLGDRAGGYTRGNTENI